MKKWKSKLIAVVTALCMALSVPVFAGSASVYAATQTMTDSIQFNRMEKPTSFHPGSLLKDLTRYSKALRSEIKSMLLILQDTGELKHR